MQTFVLFSNFCYVGTQLTGGSVGIHSYLHGESGLLIDDGIDDGVVGTLQSYIIDHQTKESNV